MSARAIGCFVVTACLLLSPATARAQTALSGGIAGVVRDTTGGVLPGVTVEAASPALIEKVRSVVTNEQGLYRIVDLRPGVYTVTFTLTGFSAVRRDGLELTSGFTATVNADLRVGGLEETITVSGESPVVDVQNVRQQTVLRRDYLDSLPSQKTIATYAALLPGARLSPTQQDVGGNHGDNNTTFSVHGSRANDMRVLVDGMRQNSFQGTNSGGAQVTKINNASAQEIVFEVGGTTAESENGGVSLNVIPREGGNRFSGYFVTSFTGPDLQSNNYTDELRARGVPAFISLKHVYDFNGGVGGPIRQDSLWFFTAHRWWGNAAYVPGMYFNKTQDSWFYTPDLDRPAHSDDYYQDNDLRFTWQVSQKHKIGAFLKLEDTCRCFSGVSGTAAPESRSSTHYHPNMLGPQITWTYPATNQLLFEAGVSRLVTHTTERRVPGVGLHHIAVTELSTGLRYRSQAGGLQAGSYGTSRNRHASQRVSVSYLSGSHSLKVGLFVQEGWRDHNRSVNDDISYTFRNQVPVSLTQWANLEGGTKVRMMPNLGVFAQDQWTMRRLTLNLGLRFDYFNAYVAEQRLPASRFLPERHFERVDDVPNWQDLSPRLGVAYDLFGTGKTAVKAYLSRYVAPEGERFPNANNPANTTISTVTRTWADANRDFVPDCDLLSPLANGECGPMSDAAFGQVRITTRYADDVRTGFGHREYNWQSSVALQHELMAGVSLNVGYFRTWYGNFTVTDNLAVAPPDFDPYCVTAPVDPRLPGGGGNQICGFYDIKPNKFGQVNNLVTHASKFGEQTEVFNGVDATIEARLPGGAVLAGGLSTGRTVTDTCDVVVDSPQKVFCRVSSAVPLSAATQFKISGVYPLPWDVQASATYQNLPGIPILASFVASNAHVSQTLGRNLGACGTRTTCNATATVDLIEPNTQFEDRITQLDVRLSRTFRFARIRAQGMFDVYNLFNASSVLAMNTRYGSAWLRPTQVLGGRTIKFGTQIDF